MGQEGHGPGQDAMHSSWAHALCMGKAQQMPRVGLPADIPFCIALCPWSSQCPLLVLCPSTPLLLLSHVCSPFWLLVFWKL